MNNASFMITIGMLHDYNLKSNSKIRFQNVKTVENHEVMYGP